MPHFTPSGYATGVDKKRPIGIEQDILEIRLYRCDKKIRILKTTFFVDISRI